jgi:hypothetical protein
VIAALEWLFGCTHPQYSFPLTVNGRCHVSCLTCGKEFTFDPVAWKRGTEIHEREAIHGS